MGGSVKTKKKIPSHGALVTSLDITEGQKAQPLDDTFYRKSSLS